MTGENLYICESCGGVTPDDCLKCPQRGTVSGVLVSKIKADLEAAPDMASLTATRKHYGRHIATLDRAGGEARTMAIQIRNLFGYLEAGFAHG